MFRLRLRLLALLLLAIMRVFWYPPSEFMETEAAAYIEDEKIVMATEMERRTRTRWRDGATTLFEIGPTIPRQVGGRL